MPDDRIYLDHAATTPLRTEVLESMMPYISDTCANPSASYASARAARKALESARESVAAAIGAFPSEVYFTSGGTESDNWALRALAERDRRHIVTSIAEHHAILATCSALEQQGCSVSYAPVDGFARTSPNNIARLVTPHTALVSVMFANNETGALNDIRALSNAAHGAGVPFHTDAVAAIGHVAVDVMRDGIDMLSMSAHKFYGPAGVGVLYISNNLSPKRMLHGGRQERGLRAGTQNVAGAVGLARALELATDELDSERRRLEQLRHAFKIAIKQTVPSTVFITPDAGSLPGTLTILIPGVNAAAAIVQLDRDGIEVSSGAACSSGAERASHVLTAVGLNAEQARSVLRITLGRGSNMDHAIRVTESLKKIVQRSCTTNTQWNHNTIEPKYSF